jgi:hypothetical protein
MGFLDRFRYTETDQIEEIQVDLDEEDSPIDAYDIFPDEGGVYLIDTVPEAMDPKDIRNLNDDIQLVAAARDNQPLNETLEGDGNLRDQISSYLEKTYEGDIVPNKEPDKHGAEFVDASLDEFGNVEITAQLYLDGDIPANPSPRGQLTLEYNLGTPRNYPTTLAAEFYN